MGRQFGAYSCAQNSRSCSHAAPSGGQAPEEHSTVESQRRQNSRRRVPPSWLLMVALLATCPRQGGPFTVTAAESGANSRASIKARQSRKVVNAQQEQPKPDRRRSSWLARPAGSVANTTINATSVPGQHPQQPDTVELPSWAPTLSFPAPLPDIDSMVDAAGVTTDTPFLLIGVLSSRRTYRRRVTLRNTWMKFITHMPTHTTMLKFVLLHDEVYSENGAQEDNILLVNESVTVTYSSILIKVFVMMEHAVEVGARFLLKTDDDAYVNIPQCVQNLLTLCTTAKCDDSRSYVGTFVGGSPVMLDPKHKWHNNVYIDHAQVRRYLPYALGGGYVLSLDIVKVLVEVHRRVGLRFTPIEDANVGMWLAGMNVRRVNWSGAMFTAGWTCCFTRSSRRVVRNDVLGRYTLSGDPCLPAMARRPIHMNDAIRTLLQQSAKAQAEQVGEEVVSMDSGGLGGGGWREWFERAVMNPRALLSSSAATATGGIRGSIAQNEREYAAEEGGLQVKGARGFKRPQRENSTSSRETAAHVVAYMDRVQTHDGMVWRTRPAILHKVANPLHLYYLQWRVTHCGVPKEDLLHDLAMRNALDNMPSTAEMFHGNHSRFAYSGLVNIVG